MSKFYSRDTVPDTGELLPFKGQMEREKKNENENSVADRNKEPRSALAKYKKEGSSIYVIKDTSWKNLIWVSRKNLQKCHIAIFPLE